MLLLDKLIEIAGRPEILTVVSLAAGYYFGRRSKHDDALIKQGYELAEQIMTLFEEIHELYEVEQKLYESNFGHIGDPRRVAEYFHSLKNLSASETARINDLMIKRNELSHLIRRARVYLKEGLLDCIDEYLRSGEITYQTDGGLFHNTFIEEFFRNLSDDRSVSQRLQLHKKVRKKARKLVS